MFVIILIVLFYTLWICDMFSLLLLLFLKFMFMIYLKSWGKYKSSFIFDISCFLINTELFFSLRKHFDILKFNRYLALSTSEFPHNFIFNPLVKWKYAFKFSKLENIFSYLFGTDFQIFYIVVRENILYVEMYWDFLYGLFHYSARFWEEHRVLRRGTKIGNMSIITLAKHATQLLYNLG